MTDKAHTAGPLWDRPVVLLVVVGFLLAVTIMFARAAIAEAVPPLMIACIANGAAGLLLLLVCVWAGQRVPFGRNIAVLLVVLGVVSFAWPNGMTYAMVESTGPAFAATVYALSPLTTLILSTLLRIEQISLVRAIGLALGLIGTVLIIWSGRRAQGAGADQIWFLLGLTIPLGLGLGNVIRTMYWPQGVSALAFSTGTLLTSCLILFGAAMAFGEPISVAEYGFFAWTHIIGLTLSSAVFFLLLFHLQYVAGPVYMSQIGYVASGFGVVLGAALFSDMPRPAGLLGIVIIILGARLVCTGPRRGMD